VQRGAAALAARCDDVDRPQAVGGPLRELHAASEEGSQLAGAERLRRKRRKRPHDVVGAVELDPASTSRRCRAPGSHVRRRTVTGPAARMWSSPNSSTSTVKLGCVSNDGKAVSLSNTSTTVPHFGDRRTESTSPCSSTRTIRRSAATGCTIRKRWRSSSASSLAPSAPKPPVWTSTSSPSARIRSITNRSTGTSSRSPGAASIALTAACSGPSRSTPMLDTPQRLEAASARSGRRHGSPCGKR
jgi:hypothetical protein